MDNLENKSLVQSAGNDLQAQYEALRHLVVSILILVVVISGTFNIYLLRQWRSTKKDLEESRPQFAQMLAGYQKSMNDFVIPVTEYGRTHPDFTPVLAKYGLKPATPTNQPPATPTSPATATPKSPKK
jgi:hypothetical protein